MVKFYKRVVDALRRRIIALLFNLKNLWRLMSRRCIVINSWVDEHWIDGVRPRNFGDDINKYLIEELTGCFVIFDHTFSWNRLFGGKNFLCIGSILESHCNRHSVVWGSGAMYGDRALAEHPLQVCAVRGPLTRQYLLSQGVNCPEVYGDPALLLPRIYSPERKIKYRIGVIPHVLDADNEILQRALADQKNICVIDLENYDDWHHVVDQIVACEMVVSSSLHGIIVSDAYGVPNCWVEFSDRVQGAGFKFRDYYLSGGIEGVEPIRISEDIDWGKLCALKEQWRKPNIDTEKLYCACPFMDHND